MGAILFCFGSCCGWSPSVFPGGKFTRYYTTVLPAVLITSALGNSVGRALAGKSNRRF